MNKQIAATLFPLFLLAGNLAADTAQLKLWFTPGGQYTAPGIDYYLTPYQAQVLSAVPSWTYPVGPITVFCDDFTNEIRTNDVWWARVSQINAADLVDTRFGNRSDPVALYTHVAYLLETLNDPHLDSYTRAVYSFAVWEVFTPNARTGEHFSGKADAVFYAAIDAALADNLWQVNHYNPGNWRVLTDVNTRADGTGGVQEYMYHVPEPSGFLLLGSGLFAVGVFVRWRRRYALLPAEADSARPAR